jgi:4-amino-4-deoxy-L-arabinose transferase-like glycosyltransferase
LRLLHLGDVPGNPFYDAAVHTMSQSWHAFLFGALDPSGGVSVDKPPVDLWAQVASVKLLGFNPTAIKLPQALAGALAVPLLYDFVRRPFGRAAGLAAAAALAVLPVAVMTARSDTMDTFMALLLLVAAWLVLRAAETGRIAWLLAAGATVGLAFNVKLFEALLPVPALALLWFAGSSLPLRRRVLGALAAAVVSVAVGFAWIVPVATTPASQRPYPIGSTDGSIWNLVFVFNGLDRLHGRALTTPDTFPAGSKLSGTLARRQQLRAKRALAGSGPTQLLSHRYRARIGSELVPAVAAGIAALVALAISALIALRRLRIRPLPRSRLRAAVAACIAVWLVTGVALFSAAGSFHPRYFETVSPALAAALGVATSVLALAPRWWMRALAIPAAAATAIYAGKIAPSVGPAAHVAVALGVAAAALLAASALGGRALRVAATTAMVCAALAVPAVASLTVVHDRAFDAETSGSMPPGWPPLLDHYLRVHRDGARYSFASIAPAKAAPLIALRPQPVLMLTSYRSRRLVSARGLARKVRSGQVRYFLIGRRCGPLTRRTAVCPPAARWAIAHSTDVTHAAGLGTHGLLYRVDSRL